MNGFRCEFLLKDNPQFRKYFWIILLIECVWLALVSSVPASQNSIEQSVFRITKLSAKSGLEISMENEANEPRTRKWIFNS